MNKILILFLSLIVFAQMSFATNVYDSNGRKIGSYRTNGSTTTKYNQYGQKESTYRKSGNTTNAYDKYGAKIGSYRPLET